MKLEYPVKVKQFVYRPGQTVRGTGGWDFQISRQSHMNVVRLSVFTPQETFLVLISVRVWVDQGHSAAGRIVWMKNYWHNRESNPRTSGL